LFRARDERLNNVLKSRINFGAGSKGEVGAIYVTGTVWEDMPAVRIAVCNWRMCRGENDIGGWSVVRKTLDVVASEWGEQSLA